MTIAQTFKSINDSIDYRNLLLAILAAITCVFLDVNGYNSENVNLKSANSIHSLVLVYLFWLAPLILIWATIRIVVSLGATLQNGISKTYMLTELLDSDDLDKHAQNIERNSELSISNATKRANKFEVIGQAAIVVAVAIPFITWIFVFNHMKPVPAEEKIDNMGLLILSASSVGALATTIAITTLRHRKVHSTEMNHNMYYRDSIHRLRVAMKTCTPTVNKEVLELLDKYANSKPLEEREEQQSPSSEDAKNVLSMIISSLHKS